MGLKLYYLFIFVFISLQATAQDTVHIKVEVDAKCNVYYTLLKVAKVAIYEWPGGAGIEPIAVNVTDMKKFSIENTEGQITNKFEGDSTVYCNADGSDNMKEWPTTTIKPFKAFSGIMHFKKSMFLVGVFVSDGVIPDEVPVTIDFTSREDYNNWTPDLYQLFYIGDGKTNKGDKLQFKIPEYANKLLLGFVDGLKGYPITRNYEDNKGVIKTTVVVYKH